MQVTALRPASVSAVTHWLAVGRRSGCACPSPKHCTASDSTGGGRRSSGRTLSGSTLRLREEVSSVAGRAAMPPSPPQGSSTSLATHDHNRRDGRSKPLVPYVTGVLCDLTHPDHAGGRAAASGAEIRSCSSLVLM